MIQIRYFSLILMLGFCGDRSNLLGLLLDWCCLNFDDEMMFFYESIVVVVIKITSFALIMSLLLYIHILRLIS